MAKRLREAESPAPSPVTRDPEPPTANCKPPTRRYWRLPHDLPAWFTDELWEEMAKKIPQDKK